MKTVLLLFGGESSEHEVSISSARNVAAAIDTDWFSVVYGYIPRDGARWQRVASIDERSGDELIPLLGQKTFKVGEDTLGIDVILPILHGLNGEDGTVQALADLLHVPCAGPSLIGAAVTIDKEVTKRLLRDAGVPVVEWLTWRVGDDMPSYEAAVAKLGPTLFVKPSRTGSSVGVSKVTDEAGFAAALTEAARFDDRVLIERAITAREIELAVLGNGDPQVTEPGEIVPGEEFYGYHDKYAADSQSHAIIPAALDNTMIEKLKHSALQAYTATRGHGMARVDFFVTEDNEIYLNEINAIPGFTSISMYPKLWQAAGKSYSQLITDLIELALE